MPAPTNARPTVPFATNASTFFGNPDQSYSKQDVHIANAVIDHDFNNGLSVKNSSRYANYDKFYQNVFPTTTYFVVTPPGQASISAYNNLAQRENLLQSDRLDLQDQYRPRASHRSSSVPSSDGRTRSASATPARSTAALPDVSASNPTDFRAVVIPTTTATDTQRLCDARRRIGLHSGPDRGQPLPAVHRRRSLRSLRPHVAEPQLGRHRRQPRAITCVATRRRDYQAGRQRLGLWQLQHFVSAKRRRPVQLADAERSPSPCRRSSSTTKSA